MRPVTIRVVDDWVAVYDRDGYKVWENHSCPLAEGLEALSIEHVVERLDEDPHFGFDQDTLTLADGSDAFPERLA